MIAEGTFREDLYHRLKVFSFNLPPLREHPEDLRPLVEYFLSRHTDMSDRSVTEDFWKAIEQRTWPGNIRELRNAIDHAVVISHGSPLSVEHLPAVASPGTNELGQPLDAAISRWVQQQLAEGHADSVNDLYRRFQAIAEPALLNEVLSFTQQNRTAAARILGLDRATLRSKIG